MAVTGTWSAGITFTVTIVDDGDTDEVAVEVGVNEGDGVCETVAADVRVPVAVADADGVMGFQDNKYDAPFGDPPITAMK
jgi:hypothetical protein